MIGLVWAQSANGVIGRDGTLPWHLPEDLKHFRALTAGATVLMGRRTWESLPPRFRPLPGRRNLVLSRTPQEGVETFPDLAQALAAVSGDVWVIGGAAVYRAALPFADRIVVTEIREIFEGDTHAPDLGRSPDSVGPWQESSTGLHYRFLTWGCSVLSVHGRYSSAMPETVPLRVQLVAKTEFFPPADVPWETDADGGQALAEFAGRACYQSWTKPNPVTATNAGYLRHILEVGHLSVLEHGSVSFYLTGVSRSLTHELIRHRHFSYSQLSQRYVPERNAAMVEPDAIAADPELHAIFDEAAATAIKAYEELLAGLQRRFADVPNATLRRKQARQAARAILPNATETRIVVTGNYRAWRHFIAMRATEHADVEIRALAVECLRQLQREVPNVFGDFELGRLDDGTEIASSPFVTEG